MPPEGPVTLLSVWTLGMALGLTACTVTCLPFMGTWALGRAEGGTACLSDTLLFLLGRFVSYTSLGALAAGLGAWFVRDLAAGVGNFFIGLASLVAALWLAWPSRENHGQCRSMLRGAGTSPFLIGIALTLIPCAPLATLLATCAATGSLLSGALYGAAFGAGALFTPMMFLIPAAGKLGVILKSQGAWLMAWIRYGAASVLTLLGARRLALVDESLAWYFPLVALLFLTLAYLRVSARAQTISQVIPIVLRRSPPR